MQKRIPRTAKEQRSKKGALCSGVFEGKSWDKVEGNSPGILSLRFHLHSGEIIQFSPLFLSLSLSLHSLCIPRIYFEISILAFLEDNSMEHKESNSHSHTNDRIDVGPRFLRCCGCQNLPGRVIYCASQEYHSPLLCNLRTLICVSRDILHPGWRSKVEELRGQWSGSSHWSDPFPLLSLSFHFFVVLFHVPKSLVPSMSFRGLDCSTLRPKFWPVERE